MISNWILEADDIDPQEAADLNELVEVHIFFPKEVVGLVVVHT